MDEGDTELSSQGLPNSTAVPGKPGMGVESALIPGRFCWAMLLLLKCMFLLKVSRQIDPDLLLSTERKAVSYVILRESLVGAFP